LRAGAHHVTVTAVAAGSITSWSPVTWQALLGEQPTVTRTVAPEVRRGSAIVFAPTCRSGARHSPSVEVRRGAAAGRRAVVAARVGVARGRGARVAPGAGPDPARTGSRVDVADEVVVGSLDRRAFVAGDALADGAGDALADGAGDELGSAPGDGVKPTGRVATGVGHALMDRAGDAG